MDPSVDRLLKRDSVVLRPVGDRLALIEKVGDVRRREAVVTGFLVLLPVRDRHWSAEVRGAGRAVAGSGRAVSVVTYVVGSRPDRRAP